ncbi:MAG: hypothetical protein AAF772_14575 [Acidobacteriota bacterium]
MADLISFRAACGLLTALGGAALLDVVLHRRVRRDQRALAKALHDQAQRLDARCDHLQQQLDDLARRQRTADLLAQVDALASTDRLTPTRADALRDAILDLQDAFDGRG